MSDIRAIPCPPKAEARGSNPLGCAIFSINKLISGRFGKLPTCRMGGDGRSQYRARAICNIGPTQDFATASFVVPAISTHIPLCHTRQIAAPARSTIIDIEDCQIHSDNVLCHILIRLTGWIANRIAACSVWRAGCSEISVMYKIERGDRHEGERTFPGTQIHPAAKWRPMGKYCTAGASRHCRRRCRGHAAELEPACFHAISRRRRAVAQ